MTAPETAEDRLRERLARYGSALEAAADHPAPARRHLVVVDGPVGGRRAPRRSSWRGPVGRVAAAVALLAVGAGATWAATRPTEPAMTTTERGWADGDVVRPEDRPSAFAALDGTWPLPAGGSLRFVLDRPADAPTTFADYRTELASTASCLWFRHALEEPGLGGEERATIAAMPTWPGRADAPQGVVDAALGGDADRLRQHLVRRCAGTAEGLGLAEIGPYWLVAGGRGSSSGTPSAPAGTAMAVDPTAVRGWDDIAARLGPDVGAVGALTLPGGGTNVALSVRSVDLSLTIERAEGPVALPVTEAELERGHEVRGDGIEVWAGAVGDGATVARVVGPGGTSVTLSSEDGPDRVEAILGDLGDLAVDLHAAAWPR